ncbi:MAG TPA: hypothetical protein VJS88_04425, partial [Chthoniobacterales bacterium]|nr:hypothetical protein [Chthoniobacterales bacterium]
MTAKYAPTPVVGTPRCGVRGRFIPRRFRCWLRTAQRAVPTMVALLALPSLVAQTDPASEPAVLAV